MAFPDDRDRELIRISSSVKDAAQDLMEWLSDHKSARQTQELEPFTVQDEFELLSACRRARNLFRSSKVPVAAAVYGASQVGKSLFIGRILLPAEENSCPLGRDENLGPPAYYSQLNFNYDLNPQNFDNEATAIVTRFTTKDRFDETVPTKYPVQVRGLTRSEWLRVLARGFRSECDRPLDEMWHDEKLEKLFEETSQRHAAEVTDREWRMDLLDAYSYLRRPEPLRYKADESFLSGLLSRYPLTNAGYVEIAAALCWNSWASLTGLFNRIWKFLEMSRQHGREGIVCHWAAVRFLLDSQRSAVHDSPNSKVMPKVAWNDLVDDVVDGWYVLDYRPGQGPPKQDLATIQSAMLELVIPVLPERLNQEWRHVLEQIDMLDIPGMRSEGRGSEKGLRASADSVDDQMEIVKRGKVFYLFDRYIEELQIQTLLLLVRGANLEVRGLLKEYVDHWGRSRYGRDNWPKKVQENPPAFFLGMTGIDLQIRDQAPNSQVFDKRLEEIEKSFQEILRDFGGVGQPFTNVYPIRYPGTWDFNAARRAANSPDNWTLAGQAFLASEKVHKYVADAERKWHAAMQDGDGGASLIAAGFRKSTSAIRKQDELAKANRETREGLKQLARGWSIDPNKNHDREDRLTSAQQVLNWILEDEQAVYSRVNSLQEVLCFKPGDVVRLADLADIHQDTRQRPEPLDRRLHRELPIFLMEWGKSTSPNRWREHLVDQPDSGEWLKPETFGTFSRNLAEYLCSESVLQQLVERLLSVISLQHRDEMARKSARRKFTRLILNDFVINPGPDLTALAEIGDQKAGRDFGLMTSFVDRWLTRLPECLASAAGAHVKIPPGNAELHEWLEDFQTQFPDELTI